VSRHEAVAARDRGRRAQRPVGGVGHRRLPHPVELRLERAQRVLQPQQEDEGVVGEQAPVAAEQPLHGAVQAHRQPRRGRQQLEHRAPGAGPVGPAGRAEHARAAAAPRRAPAASRPGAGSARPRASMARAAAYPRRAPTNSATTTSRGSVGGLVGECAGGRRRVRPASAGRRRRRRPPC
jgi:hypothetical protein